MAVLNFNPLDYLEAKKDVLKNLLDAYDKSKKVSKIEKNDVVSYNIIFSDGTVVIFSLDAIHEEPNKEKGFTVHQSFTLKASTDKTEHLAFIYHDIFHENTESLVIKEDENQNGMWVIYFIFGNEVISK